jgi:hypothetical protein
MVEKFPVGLLLPEWIGILQDPTGSCRTCLTRVSLISSSMNSFLTQDKTEDDSSWITDDEEVEQVNRSFCYSQLIYKYISVNNINIFLL